MEGLTGKERGSWQPTIRRASTGLRSRRSGADIGSSMAPWALLMRRAQPPAKGKWALPGGFVDLDESLDAAARRILHEKARIASAFLEQLYTFGAVDRDPRTRIITVAYYALLPAARFEKALKASRDLALAKIVTSWKGEAGGRAEAHGADGERHSLAFDHADILGLAVEAPARQAPTTARSASSCRRHSSRCASSGRTGRSSACVSASRRFRRRSTRGAGGDGASPARRDVSPAELFRFHGRNMDSVEKETCRLTSRDTASCGTCAPTPAFISCAFCNGPADRTGDAVSRLVQFHRASIAELPMDDRDMVLFFRESFEGLPGRHGAGQSHVARRRPNVLGTRSTSASISRAAATHKPVSRSEALLTGMSQQLATHYFAQAAVHDLLNAGISCCASGWEQGLCGVAAPRRMRSRSLAIRLAAIAPTSELRRACRRRPSGRAAAEADQAIFERRRSRSRRSAPSPRRAAQQDQARPTRA